MPVSRWVLQTANTTSISVSKIRDYTTGKKVYDFRCWLTKYSETNYPLDSSLSFFTMWRERGNPFYSVISTS